MKRLSGQFGVRRLIAVAGAGVLLSAGLGVAGASAADRAPHAAGGTRATSVPMLPCALKYASGSLYVGSGDAVYKVSQQTGNATGIVPQLPRFSAFNSVCGVAVDGAGNLLVADGPQVITIAAKNGAFYGKKMVKGHAYLIATGFEGAGAVDVQLDPAGNVVIAVGGALASHTDNEQDSQIIVLAERTGTFYGKRMVRGKLYVIAGVLNGGPSPTPCDGPDAAAANAAAPAAAAKATTANLGYTIGTLRFDAAGNIILADSGGDSGSPCGAETYDVPPRVAVIPARTGGYYGQKMTVGDIYSIAGLGSKTGNGVPAVDSKLPTVMGAALDHAGNILVATGNNSGAYPAVAVIAAKTGSFYGQKMTKGDLYTLFRSLPGASGATSVAVDNAGNVLIGTEYVVRMLAEKTGGYYGVKARAGHVYTIAGTGSFPG
jgi:hypothetical protein